MNKYPRLQNVLRFFITRILLGTIVVAGLVALTEMTVRPFLVQSGIRDILVSLIMGFLEPCLALVGYILVFRWMEQRKITELAPKSLAGNALLGLSLGFLLQALFVGVLFLSGHYAVTGLQPVLLLIPSLATALIAGFVTEILIRGIFFRILEEKLGTMVTLALATMFFAMMHTGSKGASWLSVCCTAAQAGFLLSTAYIYSRNLWLPVFFHFAWDFAEPGIFGGINPGNTISQSLFNSSITGPDLLTGGGTGPQNSIQALVICMITGCVFLWLAKRKRYLRPFLNAKKNPIQSA